MYNTSVFHLTMLLDFSLKFISSKIKLQQSEIIITFWKKTAVTGILLRMLSENAI